jgi:hypothetical protein
MNVARGEILVSASILHMRNVAEFKGTPRILNRRAGSSMAVCENYSTHASNLEKPHVRSACAHGALPLLIKLWIQLSQPTTGPDPFVK